MPIVPNEPRFLRHICPHCGQVNISERQTCKHCGALLGPLPGLPAMSKSDPSRMSYTVFLPHIPGTILASLCAVLFLIAIIAVAVIKTDFVVALCLVLLGSIAFYRPDRRRSITLTLSASALDFEHANVDIRTDWQNVESITDGEIITLYRPAATRLEPPRRNSISYFNWNANYQCERTIFLHDFESADVTAIVEAVRRYAPSVRIQSTATAESDDPADMDDPITHSEDLP